MEQYAEIAFPTPLRKTFTYLIPINLEAAVKPGIRVYAPLRNRFTIGIVHRTHTQKPDYPLKKIKEALDTIPLFSAQQFQLAEWIAKYYYCSLGEVFQAMLPAGLNYQSVKYIRCLQIPESGWNQSIIHQLSLLFEKGAVPLHDWLNEHRDFATLKLDLFVEKGLIELWDEPKIKTKETKVKVWNWTDENAPTKALLFLDSQKRTSKWLEILKKLTESSLPLIPGEYLADDFPYAQLKRIEKEGFIKQTERVKQYQEQEFEFNPEKIRLLNEEQQSVFNRIHEKIQESVYQHFLLKGITGSGKTEVYIHAIKSCLESGKGAMVLVPEIALTPQTVRRFYEIFGDQIAVVHSRLSDQERLAAWRELQSGKKMIVIGPRSAVFAPIKNLGLIIVDEEHDQSYRQEDPAPRYQGRDTAIMRAFIENCPVVCGSATPSLTSWNLIQNGKSELLELRSRHAGAELPKVSLIDLKQYKSAMKGSLTIPLKLAMDEALSKNEQVILLLNRRGYAPYLQCTDCGEIQNCPYCSVSLTYHKPSNSFRCHYCGYSRSEFSNCSKCGTSNLLKMGLGTQKVEEEIAELFPNARLLRMDQDTTSGKNKHRTLTETFRTGKADILIGTQLVSKGLDFPNVTVVGVINTDTELAFPSYRSTERMFQLLSQVAGRSGRGEKKGHVFLQTWKPENPVFDAVIRHHYELFATDELQRRKEVLYPPYCKLIQFTFKGKNDEQTARAAEFVHHILKNVAPKLPLLGPTMATIHKIDKEFYWEIILKVSPHLNTKGAEQLLDQIVPDFEAEKQFSAVRLYVRTDI